MTQKKQQHFDSNYWELMSKYICEGIHKEDLSPKYRQHLYTEYSKHKEQFEHLCTEYKEDEEMRKRTWKNIEEELQTSGEQRARRIAIFCIVCLFWSILIVLVSYLLWR